MLKSDLGSWGHQEDDAALLWLEGIVAVAINMT